MSEHGGAVREAARRYGIGLEEWIDLSTGVSPIAWPVESLGQGSLAREWRMSWARLPQEDDGLEEAACRHYGAEHVLATAGSLEAIRFLPRLREPGSKVAILHPTFSEHQKAWEDAGFEVGLIGSGEIGEAVRSHEVVVLGRPNNPTGENFERHAKLAESVQ